MIEVRRQRLNNRGETLSNSILMTTHPAGCSEHRCLAYTLRRLGSVQLIVGVQLIEDSEWMLLGSLATSRGGGRLGLSTKVLVLPVMSAKRWGVDELRAIYLDRLFFYSFPQLSYQLKSGPNAEHQETTSGIYALTF